MYILLRLKRTTLDGNMIPLLDYDVITKGIRKIANKLSRKGMPRRLMMKDPRQTTLDGGMIPLPGYYSIKGDPGEIAVRLRRRGFSVYRDTTICDDLMSIWDELEKFACRRGGDVVVCEDLLGVPYGLAVMGDKTDLLAFIIAETLS